MLPGHVQLAGGTNGCVLCRVLHASCSRVSLDQSLTHPHALALSLPPSLSGCVSLPLFGNVHPTRPDGLPHSGTLRICWRRPICSSLSKGLLEVELGWVERPGADMLGSWFSPSLIRWARARGSKRTRRSCVTVCKSQRRLWADSRQLPCRAIPAAGPCIREIKRQGSGILDSDGRRGVVHARNSYHCQFSPCSACQIFPCLCSCFVRSLIPTLGLRLGKCHCLDVWYDECTY